MQDSRERMLGEIKQGNVSDNGDASNKVVLIRGCDPVMAQRAGEFLPKMIGDAKIESSTDDNTFINQLKGRKYDVVMFAPGACRHNAAKNPIPGGNSHTNGWSLMQYRELVKLHQGNEVPIVETIDEKEIVPRLRSALGL